MCQLQLLTKSVLLKLSGRHVAHFDQLSVICKYIFAGMDGSVYEPCIELQSAAVLLKPDTGYI